MSILGKLNEIKIIKKTNNTTLQTSCDTPSNKIQISPKEIKSRHFSSIKPNKLINEELNKSKISSPTIKRIKRKYSDNTISPYKSQSLSKKPTSFLVNPFKNKPSDRLYIKIKSDYTFAKIAEEKISSSFSPTIRNNILGSSIFLNRTTRDTKKKIKEKNTNYLYIVIPGNNSELIRKCMSHRINWAETTNQQNYNFKWQHISAGLDFDNLSKNPSYRNTVNHLEFHQVISNKMNLFTNLMKFCEKRNLEIFKYIPFTLIMQYDSKTFTSQFDNFVHIFNKMKDFISKDNNLNKESQVKYGSLFKVGYEGDKVGLKTSITINSTYYTGKNMWLVKAVDLNRGRCIKIGNDVDEVKTIIRNFYEGIYKSFKKQKEEEMKKDIEIGIQVITLPTKEPVKKKIRHTDYRKYRTSCVLLQKYLESPLLYWGRKFDVRVWVLYTHKECVYAFKQGHLKTSSLNYDINETNSFVHLTNYSVQKYNQEFSKHECGNEVPYSEFQKSLDFQNGEGKVDVQKDIVKKIHKLIKLTFFSVRKKINMNNRKFCFELFGFDFIIDKNLEVYLLEVNTNPGLEESSPWINILLPRMIDDAFRLTLDDIYETKYSHVKEGETYESPYNVEGYDKNENLWELVTDFCDYENKSSI